MIDTNKKQIEEKVNELYAYLINRERIIIQDKKDMPLGVVKQVLNGRLILLHEIKSKMEELLDVINSGNRIKEIPEGSIYTGDIIKPSKEYQKFRKKQANEDK